jgi:hypothetical protein
MWRGQCIKEFTLKMNTTKTLSDKRAEKRNYWTRAIVSGHSGGADPGSFRPTPLKNR